MSIQMVNDRGVHALVPCCRCQAGVLMPVHEMQADPSPVMCSACQEHLDAHPEVARAEFEAAQRRSDAAIGAMRERWARQDAALEGAA